MMKIISLITVSGILLGSSVSLSHAGLITSTGDISLTGASVEDFNSATLGTYPTLALSGVTLSSSPAFSIQDGGGGVYAPPNPPGDQYIFVGDNSSNFSLRFTFSSSVSAFGIVIGAANQIQAMRAYDSGDNLLETHNIPDQVGTLPFPYSGFYGINSNTANISYFTVETNNDIIILDDLYFTSTDATVPEPASLALFGLGSLGMGVIARRRKQKLELAS